MILCPKSKNLKKNEEEGKGREKYEEEQHKEEREEEMKRKGREKGRKRLLEFVRNIFFPRQIYFRIYHILYASDELHICA